MKALSLSVSLLALALLLNALPVSHTSAAVPVTYPAIVARGHRTNETHGLTIPIHLPSAENGLYRLSMYGDITQNDASTGSTWAVSLDWRDDVIREETLVMSASDGSLGQFTGGVGGRVIVFESAAGQDATLQIAHHGAPDTSAYSVYWEVEQLK